MQSALESEVWVSASTFLERLGSYLMCSAPLNYQEIYRRCATEQNKGILTAAEYSGKLQSIYFISGSTEQVFGKYLHDYQQKI